MEFHSDAPPIDARIRCAPDLLWWVRWRDIVAYRTAFGTLEWNGRRGVALVEHAWGMQTRANLARYAPRWHWDVLAFEAGWACAGRWSALGPLRSGGRMPGEPFRRGRGLRVRRIDAERWVGRLRLGRRVLEYEARAATPLSPTVPGGGMM